MKLMSYGVMATLNQEIDYDTAEIIASEFDIKAEKLVEVTPEEILFDDSRTKRRTCCHAHLWSLLWGTSITVKPLFWTISVKHR